MEIGNEKLLYVDRRVLPGETVLLVRDHNTDNIGIILYGASISGETQKAQN